MELFTIILITFLICACGSDEASSQSDQYTDNNGLITNGDIIAESQAARQSLHESVERAKTILSNSGSNGDYTGKYLSGYETPKAEESSDIENREGSESAATNNSDSGSINSNSGETHGDGLKDQQSKEVGDESIYKKTMPGSKDDIINNIDVKADAVTLDMGSPAGSGKLLGVTLTNNNAFVIPDVDISVVFYKDGTMVSEDNDGHDVFLPEKQIASRIEAPEDYDDYKIDVDVDWKYAVNYRNWTDGISLNSNIGADNVMMEFTNNNDVDIEELEYIVFFYNGGKLVDITFPQDVHDIDAGQTITKQESAIGEFDDYKIFINQAHTFGH